MLINTYIISLINSFSLYENFLIIFYCYSIIVVPMFSLCPPPPIPTLLPQSIPTLVSMFMGHSYMFFDQSLLLLSTIIPFPPTLGHCQSVPHSHASGSIQFISLFCSLDSSYRCSHMAFVFHQLTYYPVFLEPLYTVNSQWWEAKENPSYEELLAVQPEFIQPIHARLTLFLLQLQVIDFYSTFRACDILGILSL